MPTLVQWKWVERTKSFLVIFHFFDDYSKPNLRMKRIKSYKIKCQALMTWAPSHVELGLLSEVLRYANIVDGLDEAVKRKLREKLEMIKVNKKEFDFEAIEEVSSITRWEGLLHLIVAEPEDKSLPYVPDSTCVGLCPEYIDYLKKVLKRYLN